MQTITIHPQDSVAVALQALEAGDKVGAFTVKNAIPAGHKVALRKIAAGDNVIKYGYPIGVATADIDAGEHVHTHNLRTGLAEQVGYTYNPQPVTLPKAEPRYFDAYQNPDGSVGIRNEIWVLPLVGCVNTTAQQIAQQAATACAALCDGVFAFSHPYGCSQMGDDQANTQQILAGLAKHPNAAGVLLVSLGCENNNLEAFLPLLGDYDRTRIRTLVVQESPDELAQGVAIVRELAQQASRRKRTQVPISELVVGYKCGGSDAFSGITANALCGRLTDLLCAGGARAILTEVPEMFGAETLLMQRAQDADVFHNIVQMVQDFQQYYRDHGQVIYENPSPGNKAGGITTLEEKSLGCIQKGGGAAVTDVLGYAQRCTKPGLSLLTGPGNDIVSCTNLVASGAHLVVFTTGRGTPLGAPVPTVKVSSNTALANAKPGWIDYDAGQILAGKPMQTAAAELLALLQNTASGEYRTKNEQNGYREIAIFKNGVTL